jgi:hypothetical protein
MMAYIICIHLYKSSNGTKEIVFNNCPNSSNISMYRYSACLSCIPLLSWNDWVNELIIKDSLWGVLFWVVWVQLSEKITWKKIDFFKLTSRVNFLKAHIKFSYLSNFQNFWTHPHWLAGVRKECIGLFFSTFSDIHFFH